jgi:hypothetical protein
MNTVAHLNCKDHHEKGKLWEYHKISLSVLSKVACKISVSFELIQNFKFLDLAMAKV